MTIPPPLRGDPKYMAALPPFLSNEANDIGDNGDFQADRGLADKRYPYEESIRVPLVVRDPRLAPGRRGVTRGQFALNLDVAPTLAAAGLAVPGVMQGRDLSPLYLNAQAPDWRDEFFYQHPTVASRNRIPSSQGVVRRDWKYIEWPEFDFRQLFDLRNDPGELRNLAGQPSHAGQQLRMRQQLEAWRRRAR